MTKEKYLEKMVEFGRGLLNERQLLSPSGLLTDSGKEATKPIVEQINNCLNVMPTWQERMAFGGALCKLVWETVSEYNKND